MTAFIPLWCCVALAACSCAIPTVEAITNAEFYDMIKEYITDVETTEAIDGQSDDVDDDVIALPGAPDDELDVGNLIEKLGLLDNEIPSRQVGWFHRHRHHHRRRVHCHCHHYRCSCCLTHTFSMHMGFRKKKYKLHACIQANYIRRDRGFSITFKLNGHVLFHHHLSLRHPPKLCYAVPGCKRFARVCLNFYNINLRRRYICTRLTGEIDIKIWKFRVHLKLGCFSIPMLKEKSLEALLNDRTVVHVDANTSLDADEPMARGIEQEHESSDVTDMFRQLREQEEDDDDFRNDEQLE